MNKARVIKENFLKFKEEFDFDMMTIHQFIQHAKDKIIANIKTKRNPNGILVQGSLKYLDCLVIKHEELERLMRSDERNWTQNIHNQSNK